MFDFGVNWQAFSKQRLSAKRLDAAICSLQSLLQRETLLGMSFLDVGCGSGIFSIAAQHLGAKKVVGIDINPRCIFASEQNRDQFVSNVPVEFLQISALDPESLQSLGVFDIVYAWGSLHHTGAMWDAIQLGAKRVTHGGAFVLAIYNMHFTSIIWKMIKWLYNRLPSFGQRLMAIVFACIIYVAKFMVTRQNPLKKERGMDFWFDVIDWIGGYPYEYSHPNDVKTFVEGKGFELHHFVPAQVPTGCNEFVFKRVVV